MGASAGYSRAVVVGDSCWVAGTTDAGPDGLLRHGLYVIDPASIPPVLAAHGERFGAIRPAAAIVVVAGLIEPSLLVEIEAEARR